MSSSLTQEIAQLRSQLLNETIDAAYAALGERPLSDEETTRLVDQCVQEVEAATWPQAQQGKGAR